MSPEFLTNTGGPAVPRHTRVLMYMGYTLLMVTTVVFFSTEQAQGAGSGQLFETDGFVGAGILELSPPLLITLFLVNLHAWLGSRPLPRPDGLDQVDRSIRVETDLDGVMGG